MKALTVEQFITASPRPYCLDWLNDDEVSHMYEVPVPSSIDEGHDQSYLMITTSKEVLIKFCSLGSWRQWEMINAAWVFLNGAVNAEDRSRFGVRPNDGRIIYFSLVNDSLNLTVQIQM